MPTYYYGWEGRADYGVEDPAAYGTAVAPTEQFSWLRSATLNVNENVEREFFIGATYYRHPDAALKGKLEVTGTLTFWLPDDLDATTLGAWILKLPMDAFNAAHVVGPPGYWIIPNTTTSAYGSNSLASFSLEVGHTKAGAMRAQILRGCVVDSFTMRARQGEKVECVLDFIAKDIQADSTIFSGSGSRSTSAPLDFGNVAMAFADDNTETARTDFTAFEFTVNNNLTPNYDLSSQVPHLRSLTNIIPGRQDISGSATINYTTTSGMQLYQAVLGDASSPYWPTTAVKNKQFNFDIRNSAAPTTQAIEWTFRNVVVGELPLDIDPTKVQEITFPWTAQYYKLEIITADTAGPTNWSDEN